MITDEHDADEKTLKIVMDFIEGDTVRNAFGSNYVEDNLPDNFPWYLMIGVLDWVIAAREQGVAHCDLHASNIMMSTPPNPEYYPDVSISVFFSSSSITTNCYRFTSLISDAVFSPSRLWSE